MTKGTRCIDVAPLVQQLMDCENYDLVNVVLPNVNHQKSSLVVG